MSINTVNNDVYNYRDFEKDKSPFFGTNCDCIEWIIPSLIQRKYRFTILHTRCSKTRIPLALP